MRTYPPSGNAFTPYSVSPRRSDHSLGPNPRKNSLILNALATPKCAASWIRMTSRMATTNRTMPRVPLISQDRFADHAFEATARRGSRRPGPGPTRRPAPGSPARSEEHTSELQSLAYLVCRLLLEKKKKVAFTAHFLSTKKCTI